MLNESERDVYRWNNAIEIVRILLIKLNTQQNKTRRDLLLILSPELHCQQMSKYSLITTYVMIVLQWVNKEISLIAYLCNEKHAEKEEEEEEILKLMSIIQSMDEINHLTLLNYNYFLTFYRNFSTSIAISSMHILCTKKLISFLCKEVANEIPSCYAYKSLSFIHFDIKQQELMCAKGKISWTSHFTFFWIHMFKAICSIEIVSLSPNM